MDFEEIYIQEEVDQTVDFARGLRDTIMLEEADACFVLQLLEEFSHTATVVGIRDPERERERERARDRKTFINIVSHTSEIAVPLYSIRENPRSLNPFYPREREPWSQPQKTL
jgi:hypothetical protein